MSGLFFILSLKHSDGDDLTWWAPGERGYRRNLNEAGLYSEQDAKRIEMHGQHNGVRGAIAVPEDTARMLAVQVVEGWRSNLEAMGTSHDEWAKAIQQ